MILYQVNGSDAVSTFFWIVPVSIGQIPIEVSAFAGLAADAVRQMLLVKVISLSYNNHFDKFFSSYNSIHSCFH